MSDEITHLQRLGQDFDRKANEQHIKALIQKAIEDDNLHAANWLRGHLAKQDASSVGR